VTGSLGGLLGGRIDRTRPVPPARFEIRTDRYDEADRAWWDPHGPAKLLHTMNPVRVAFFLDQLRDGLGEVRGRRVLDAGCGGGLVAAGLAGAGATVVGVDQSPASLGVAGRHVPAGFTPLAGTLERLPLADGAIDAVVAADVLEHVGDLPAVVAELARVLAPGGLLLFDTVNRTGWAWFVAIFGAERMVGLVPRGTHDWRLFIRPGELDRLLREAGLAPVRVAGLVPRITPAVVARGLATRHLDPPSWRLGRSRRASYVGSYRKTGSATGRQRGGEAA
jgi:2-polyprenyl-6-hydroxyphenyl methylase / 3-demethylubiquinone-9 3-methyltransferase